MDFEKIDDEIICCGMVSILISHEPQPIADQVKRVYRCASCEKQRRIFIDIFTGEYE